MGCVAMLPDAERADEHSGASTKIPLPGDSCLLTSLPLSVLLTWS